MSSLIIQDSCDIAIDNQGSIYILNSVSVRSIIKIQYDNDNGTYTISKVINIDEIVNPGSSYLKFDKNNNLYFNDNTNIFKVDLDNLTYSSHVFTDGYGDFNNFDFDNDNNLFIATDQCILAYNSSGSFIATYLFDVNKRWFSAISFDKTNKLYFTVKNKTFLYSNTVIYTLDKVDNVISVVPYYDTEHNNSNITNILFNDDNELFITQGVKCGNSFGLYKITENGYHNYANSIINGLCFTNHNTILCVSTNSIFEINNTTKLINTFLKNSLFTALAYNNNNELFCYDKNNKCIYKINNNQYDSLTLFLPNLANLITMDFDKNNNLYYCESNNNFIRKIDFSNNVNSIYCNIHNPTYLHCDKNTNIIYAVVNQGTKIIAVNNGVISNVITNVNVKDPNVSENNTISYIFYKITKHNNKMYILLYENKVFVYNLDNFEKQLISLNCDNIEDSVNSLCINNQEQIVYTDGNEKIHIGEQTIYNLNTPNNLIMFNNVLYFTQYKNIDNTNSIVTRLDLD